MSETTNKAAAMEHADRIAALDPERPQFVLSTGGQSPVFWTCGPNMKRELWPDREPVYIGNPSRSPSP